MNYVLILSLYMFGVTHKAGQGGVSVSTERFETLEQCLVVKEKFLGMTVNKDQIVPRGYISHVKVVRQAECVKI